MQVCDCDEGPGEVVSIPNAFEPSGFGWESCSNVEIPDCALYAGKFVDVLNGLGGWWVGGDVGRKCEVSEHFCVWWDNTGGVKGVKTRGAIEEKRISVEIGDVGLEWDAPELSLGASSPFEDRHLGHLNFCCTAVKNVDLVAVADGDVPCFSKFSAAEEGVIG